MKIIFYIIIAVGTVYVASIITPDSIKNRVTATVGLNDFSLTETIFNTAGDAKDAVADKIIPKSAHERRSELIERMEQSLAEIQAAQEEIDVSFEAVDEHIIEHTSQLIAETEEVLEELKQEEEKTKEGAIRTLIRSTANVINKVTGGDNDEPLPSCE